MFHAEEEAFTETTTAIAAGARAQPHLVRKYARAGWLTYRVASDGTLLFQPAAAARVRELKAAGLARRGRRAVGSAA